MDISVFFLLLVFGPPLLVAVLVGDRLGLRVGIMVAVMLSLITPIFAFVGISLLEASLHHEQYTETETLPLVALANDMQTEGRISGLMFVGFGFMSGRQKETEYIRYAADYGKSGVQLEQIPAKDLRFYEDVAPNGAVKITKRNFVRAISSIIEFPLRETDVIIEFHIPANSIVRDITIDPRAQ